MSTNLLTAISFLLFPALSFADPSESYIRKNAIQLDSGGWSSVVASISTFKIITIGEMHGSQETPQFVHNLFVRLQSNYKVILGIEVPQLEQQLVDKFIQTKDRTLLKQSKFFSGTQDGRSSEAMVKLLENLPKSAVVICFDYPNASSGQARDQQMAENLVRAFELHRPDNFIILAGNIHSRIEVGTPFDPNYQPMSYFLHTLPKSPISVNDIRAIQVRYAGGNIWACMGPTEADCNIHQMNPPPSAYSSAVNLDSYFLNEPLSDGHNATVFFRSLTASPPAFP